MPNSLTWGEEGACLYLADGRRVRLPGVATVDVEVRWHPEQSRVMTVHALPGREADCAESIQALRRELGHMEVESAAVQVRSADDIGPHRLSRHHRCPRCDVTWEGTPACWVCGEQGEPTRRPLITDQYGLG